jgi:hypothetical protein
MSGHTLGGFLSWSVSVAFLGLMLGCPSPDVASDVSVEDVGTDVGPPTDAVETDLFTDVSQPDSGVDTSITQGPGLGIDYAASEAGIEARYEPSSDEWTSTGWPSDRYRTEDGRVDLSNFPNPGTDLLDLYLDYGEEVLDGFGLNSAIYVQFDGFLDPESLPKPEETLDPLGLVQLINVDPTSPTFGARRPLTFRTYDYGIDFYYLPGTLAMLPQYGLPLAEGTTYCAVVTRGLKDDTGRYLSQNETFAEAIDTAPSLDLLRAWLPTAQLRRDDIAVATCFTTQDATRELRLVGDALDTMTSPVIGWVDEPLLFGEFHGFYVAPNFQAGSKPYDDDGDLRFGEDGVPIVQAEEEVRFMLLVPREDEMPPDGWPIVLYAHGTGGDYESCRGISSDLAQRAIALLCIDQPLHGSRGDDYNDSELVNYSFNFVNPRSGRSGFRQSAIDTMVLARMVEDGRFNLDPADTDSGIAVQLDASRLAFFGHSHGGLSGALVLGVEPRIKAGVLSGAAGVLVETILRRKDPFDVASLVQALLVVQEEDFDSFHPTLTMVQTLVDATDPINYAPYWTAPKDGSEPKHVFVTEGTWDHASPSVGTDALASAAGLPQLLDLAKVSDGHRLQGLEPEIQPVSMNVGSGDWLVTGGLKQWQEGNHWVAFNRSEARAMWRTFLEEFAYGDVPTIGPGAHALTTTDFSQPGETCGEGDFIPVDALPLVLRSNTALFQDDFAGGSCVGEPELGAGQRDVAYRLKPDVQGTYAFTLSYPDPLEKGLPTIGPDLLSIASGCAEEGQGLCVAGSVKGNIEVELQAGEEVAVLVDSSDIEHRGPFTLRVDLVCEVKECGERTCGTWGCESCGSCGLGELCSSDGQCEAAPSLDGDRCDTAIELGPLPILVAGDTSAFAPDYFYVEGACSNTPHGYGKTSSDVVYAFAPPSPGTYVFRLDADYDANLFVRSDCEANDTCLVAHRNSKGGEKIVVDLESTEPLFVFVDGVSNSVNRRGNYTLRIDVCEPQCGLENPCGSDGCGGTCGSCDEGFACHSDVVCDPFPMLCQTTSQCDPIPVGDQCGEALTIEGLPFTYEGTTYGFDPNYSYGSGQCPGESGSWGGSTDDVVFDLTIPSDGLYEFKLKASANASLYLVEDCDDIASTCLGAKKVTGKKGYKTMYKSFVQGQTMVAVVDGGSSFTLKVRECIASCEGKTCGTDGCGGSCGSCAAGETCSGGGCIALPGIGCESARTVGALPWEHETKNSSYFASFMDACVEPALGEGSKDVLYMFTPPKDGTYSAIVSANYPTHVYAFTECAEPAQSCLGNVMDGVSGVQTTFEATLGQPVYLVVDGADDDGSALGGAYTLRVEEACFPQCEGKTCGDDGCGRTCGACVYPADLCDGQGVCQEPTQAAGYSVESALVVGELPFTAESDTSLSSNHHWAADGECPGYVMKGRYSFDEVWRVVVPESGLLKLTAAPVDFDMWLSVWKKGEVGSVVCFAATDGQLDETLVVEAEPGSEVFIVVDGVSNKQNDAGPYTLTVQSLD